MTEITQNSEKEKPEPIKDWVVHSELRKRVENLIISSLEDQFGAVHTQQIIKTAISRSGQPQSEMFSDYETFARTIKDVFGKEGQNSILDKISV